MQHTKHIFYLFLFQKTASHQNLKYGNIISILVLNKKPTMKILLFTCHTFPNAFNRYLRNLRMSQGNVRHVKKKDFYFKLQGVNITFINEFNIGIV